MKFVYRVGRRSNEKELRNILFSSNHLIRNVINYVSMNKRKKERFKEEK